MTTHTPTFRPMDTSHETPIAAARRIRRKAEVMRLDVNGGSPAFHDLGEIIALADMVERNLAAPAVTTEEYLKQKGTQA